MSGTYTAGDLVPTLFFTILLRCTLTERLQNGEWGKGGRIRKVFTFAPFIFNIMRGFMKNNISYVGLIIKYKNNSMRKGCLPTKVYLTTEQIAELLEDSMFSPYVAQTDYSEPMTVFGLTIVNVDDL